MQCNNKVKQIATLIILMGKGSMSSFVSLNEREKLTQKCFSRAPRGLETEKTRSGLERSKKFLSCFLNVIFLPSFFRGRQFLSSFENCECLFGKFFPYFIQRMHSLTRHSFSVDILSRNWRIYNNSQVPNSFISWYLYLFTTLSVWCLVWNCAETRIWFWCILLLYGFGIPWFFRTRQHLRETIRKKAARLAIQTKPVWWRYEKENKNKNKSAYEKRHWPVSLVLSIWLLAR